MILIRKIGFHSDLKLKLKLLVKTKIEFKLSIRTNLFCLPNVKNGCMSQFFKIVMTQLLPQANGQVGSAGFLFIRSSGFGLMYQLGIFVILNTVKRSMCLKW